MIKKFFLLFVKNEKIKKNVLLSFILMDSNIFLSFDYKIKICWFKLENY